MTLRRQTLGCRLPCVLSGDHLLPDPPRHRELDLHLRASGPLPSRHHIPRYAEHTTHIHTRPFPSLSLPLSAQARDARIRVLSEKVLEITKAVVFHYQVTLRELLLAEGGVEGYLRLDFLAAQLNNTSLFIEKCAATGEKERAKQGGRNRRGRSDRSLLCVKIGIWV